MNRIKFSLAKVTILILIFISVVSLYIYRDFYNKSYGFKNGTIDLRNENLDNNVVKLNGQWEFYKNQLLTPADFNNIDSVNKNTGEIPGTYKGLISGTYRLKIRVKDVNQVYAVYLPFIQSCYKLWINDKLAAEVGKVSINEKEVVPKLIPKTCEFYADKEEIYLTLQVSCIPPREAFIDEISFGKAEILNSINSKNMSYDLLVFGAGLIMTLYYLITYYKRRKDKYVLFIGIVCSFSAMRILFLDNKAILVLFPNLSYLIYEKIVYWMQFMYIPMFIYYVNGADIKLSKIILKATYISSILYTILIILLPCKYFNYVITPFLIFGILMNLFILFSYGSLYVKTDRWKMNTPKGFLIIIVDFASYLGFSLFTMNNLEDVFHNTSKMESTNYNAGWVLFFLAIGMYIVAASQNKYFNELENMSARLKALDKAKDDFLAMTTHELKTPLNGIIGLTQKLYSNIHLKLNSEEKSELLLINSSATRLSKLVNDILTYSKLKTGDVELNNKSINVYKIVQVVILMLGVSEGNNRVEINNKIDSSLPLVYGDEERIIQIFNNLLHNSLKFTKEGEITITSKAIGDYVEISIRDTGIGIPEHKLDNVFNMYEQVDGVSNNYGGNGLGLYITKRLIELHGGSIKISSIVNEGSEFKFTLPKYNGEMENQFIISDNEIEINQINNVNENMDEYKIIEEKHEFASENNELEELYKGKEKVCHKILVADDEEVNRRLIKFYLSKGEYQIIEASDGKEVLDIIKKEEGIDIVILDMMMPDMNGNEVCINIRKNYSLYELPILVITADSRLESLINAYNAGANEYMLKPFSKYELAYRVKTIFTMKDSVSKAIRLSKQMDMTNNKMVKLIEYDKIKTEFFANISHELRTPLNVISSTIQLLQSLNSEMSIGEDRIKYYFNSINQNTKRLLRLINNLMDVTRVEAGYLKLNLQSKDIVYVVEQVSQSVAEYAREKGIALIFDTEIEEKIMNFDQDKIERIILNLLSNAVKFTEKGGNIFVNLLDKGDCVSISVADTGIGIPEDKLEFIFERFAQVDKSITRKNEGSGIGLTLVKTFVELHEGSITADSKLGFGSEFVVNLPVKRSTDEPEVNNYMSKKVQDYKYDEKVAFEFSDIYLW